MNKNREDLRAIVEDYVPFNEPDGAKVASILSKAIGKRSNKEFAPLIGISEPTLSRYRNGKITRPMSVDLIMNIFENQDVPPEGEWPVDVFELFEANGYISKAEQQIGAAKKKLQKTRFSAFRAERELMSMIIKTELFNRGIDLDQSDLEYKVGRLETIIGNTQRCDFATWMGMETEHYFGLFFTIPQMLEDFKSSVSADDPEVIVRQIMNEMSPLFLTDAWNPEYYDQMKLHFCFADKTFYEIFVKKMEVAKFHNRFSAIYIDTKDLHIKEETSFKASDKKSNTNFFDRKIIRGLSWADDEVANEITGVDFLVSSIDEDAE